MSNSTPYKFTFDIWLLLLIVCTCFVHNYFHWLKFVILYGVQAMFFDLFEQRMFFDLFRCSNNALNLYDEYNRCEGVRLIWQTNMICHTANNFSSNTCNWMEFVFVQLKSIVAKPKLNPDTKASQRFEIMRHFGPEFDWNVRPHHWVSIRRAKSIID